MSPDFSNCIRTATGFCVTATVIGGASPRIRSCHARLFSHALFSKDTCSSASWKTRA